MATRWSRRRQALTFATFDSTLALMFALLINASILILAAATFHATGQTEIAELGEAHQPAGAAARPRHRAHPCSASRFSAAASTRR